MHRPEILYKVQLKEEEKKNEQNLETLEEIADDSGK